MDNLSITNITFDGVPQQPFRSEHGELLFCESGHIRIYINQHLYELNPGSAIMIFPEQIVLLCEADRQLILASISFSKEFLQDLFYSFPSDKVSFLREHNCCSFHEEGQKLMHQYLQLLTLKLADNQNHYQNEQGVLCIRMILYEIAEKAERIYSDTQSTTACWQLKDKFVSMVGENIRRFRSVDYYASHLCVTVRHLSKVIKQTMGYTAKQWIDNYAILEMKVALQSATLSIQEVAWMFRFPDPSTFSRYFKKRTGYSPSEYRFAISKANIININRDCVKSSID
ncbi:helix-turn-helix domain-containing protein [Parabacteroides sp.]